MTRGAPPPEILEAARRRAVAREARDWATADHLRAEIEAAGWRVVDSGTSFKLEPAHPPDVIQGEVVRYGRSEAVPSRLEEPDDGLATVVIVGTDDALAVVRAVTALGREAPSGLSVVVVANGMSAPAEAEVEEGVGAEAGSAELIRTSARLGHAAALNIGFRRSIGSTVIVLDPGLEPDADLVTPLVRALEDPAVAVAGPLGFASADLRRFDEVTAAGPDPATAVAIEGGLMAFSRADAALRGPLDEQFRVADNLDIWWSLVLRDEGEDRSPRRAVLVADVPLRRHDDGGGSSAGSAERERLARRNYYRVLDRFGRRLDLAIPGE